MWLRLLPDAYLPGAAASQGMIVKREGITQGEGEGGGDLMRGGALIRAWHQQPTSPHGEINALIVSRYHQSHS